MPWLFVLVFALGYVCSPVLAAGVRTCEELSAKIVGRTYTLGSEHTGISWPKSISQSKDLENSKAELADRFFNDAERGTFVGDNNIVMPYRIFKTPNERGAVVIVHGMTESMPFYLEMVETLRKEGYSVYILDQRGHGYADREIANPQKVHVEKFSDYVKDLKTFVDKVVDPKSHPRTFGLANSMGGLVITNYLKEHPEDFDAVVASVPAYKIQTKGFSTSTANRLLWFLDKTGFGNYYAYGRGNFEEAARRDHPFTHDPVRFSLYFELLERFPMLRMGGPTNHWVLNILRSGQEARNNIHKIARPLLTFRAGMDNVVDPTGIDEAAGKSKLITKYSDSESLHQLLFEKDEIRNAALTEAMRFLVNPTFLHDPARPDEFSRLLDESKRYLDKGDVAFARYAFEESLRVYDRKRDQMPDWDSAELQGRKQTLEDLTFRALKGSSLGEKGLYRFLTYQRKEELNRLYPPTN